MVIDELLIDYVQVLDYFAKSGGTKHVQICLVIGAEKDCARQFREDSQRTDFFTFSRAHPRYGCLHSEEKWLD